MLFQIATLLSVAHYNMTYRGLCEERETACTYPQTCLPLRHIHHFFYHTAAPPPPSPSPPHTHARVMSDSSVHSCTSYSVFTLLCYTITGTEYRQFQSMQEFKKWKELEEERTYSAYVQQQIPYQPKGTSGISNQH